MLGQPRRCGRWGRCHRQHPQGAALCLRRIRISSQSSTRMGYSTVSRLHQAPLHAPLLAVPELLIRSLMRLAYAIPTIPKTMPAMPAAANKGRCSVSPDHLQPHIPTSACRLSQDERYQHCAGSRSQRAHMPKAKETRTDVPLQIADAAARPLSNIAKKLRT